MNEDFFISGDAIEVEELIENLQDDLGYEIDPSIFNI